MSDRRTTDTPQISFSEAGAAVNGAGVSEAQPMPMSRWLEKLGGGPRRGSLSTSNTHMGGLTPPSYAVAHDDNSRDGTPGPAGVGAIAARMFSGLGEYVSFGANSTAATAGHQMNTPSQHDHDMMFGAGVVVSSTPPPTTTSAQQQQLEQSEGYTTMARFLADEGAEARDGMEVADSRRGPSGDISGKVTSVIPMENFPVATNESLESLQELSTKRVARESNSEVAVFDMDVIPEESSEGERSKKSSREERREEIERHQDEGHYKIAEKLLSSRATQNWFFQNSQSAAAADGAAVAEAADAAARKAKEFHMWSPQTM